MAQHWSVEEPTTLDVPGVRRLSLRVVSGEVDVVAGPDVETARVEVHDLEGPPLRVTLDDDGTLSVVHDKLTWGGLLDWLKGPHKASAHVSVSVPADVDVQLGVVDADATVSGVSGATSVKSVSGEVTLSGCSGEVTAQTVSGRLESQGLDGRLHFSSVSGDVTLRLPSEPSLDVNAQSVSGRMTAGEYGLTDDSGPGRRRMRGAIGGGAAKLSAKTVSGDVTLLPRDA
jgi:hypothetical protein